MPRRDLSLDKTTCRVTELDRPIQLERIGLQFGKEHKKWRETVHSGGSVGNTICSVNRRNCQGQKVAQKRTASSGTRNERTEKPGVAAVRIG